MSGRDGQFFPDLFLLFRAVVGSIARRVLVVKSSRSLCAVRRLSPTPGDTLPASPLLGYKITGIISLQVIKRSYTTARQYRSLACTLMKNTAVHAFFFLLPSRRFLSYSLYRDYGLDFGKMNRCENIMQSVTCFFFFQV